MAVTGVLSRTCDALTRAGGSIYAFTLANRAKTHCPAGHPYDETNTYVSKAARRICRACHRDRARERRAASR